MNTRKTLFIGSMALLMLAFSAPSMAVIKTITQAVAEVSTSDDAALGGAAFNRIYTSCDPGINKNNSLDPACNGKQCRKTYTTTTGLNPGGYDSTTEDMNIYCGGIDNIPTYSIWDGQVAAGTINHQAFYGAATILATSDTNVRGSRLTTGCFGTAASNCMKRLDSTSGVRPAATPILNVLHGFGAANSVRSIGGLSPVPVPKLANVRSGIVRVRWDDPQSYSAAEKGGVASPIQGVNLYRFDDVVRDGVCVEPNGSKDGWQLVGEFGMFSGAIGGDFVIPAVLGNAECSFFAITVRYLGPGGAGTLESGSQAYSGADWVGGHSQPISLQPYNVRIIRINARYEGQGNIAVRWESAVEGGLTGFYVQRAATADGPYARVSGMIAATGDNSRYSMTDRVTPTLGRVLYYRLEVVAADGASTLTGPTAVTVPIRKKTGTTKGPDRN